MDPRGVEADELADELGEQFEFQMDPRGVEADNRGKICYHPSRFQMDPRGVEATWTRANTLNAASFRWTLVGLKLVDARVQFALAVGFQMDPRGVEAARERRR